MQAAVVEQIDAAMSKAKLGVNYSDKLVVGGELQPCETTVLMGLLERERYPTGLTVRLGRTFDDYAGDHGCDFGGAPKPTVFQGIVGLAAKAAGNAIRPAAAR